MRSAGASIPEIVRGIITSNRSIYDCIRMDLINYTALAVRIQSKVEKITGSPVNLNTMVVAIKRYADSFETEYVKDEHVLKNARLSLTDGIMDIKVSIRDLNEMDAGTMLNRFSKITDNYDFFRLSDSFRFLTEDMESVREIFEEIPNREEMFSTGLAKIRIFIPEGQNKSDAVSYVAEVLHENGVELKNAFFGQDDITIILDENNASKAYDVLHSDILRYARS